MRPLPDILVWIIWVLLRWASNSATSHSLAGQGCRWCCLQNALNLTTHTLCVLLVEGAMARVTSLESYRSIVLLGWMGLV